MVHRDPPLPSTSGPPFLSRGDRRITIVPRFRSRPYLDRLDGNQRTNLQSFRSRSSRKKYFIHTSFGTSIQKRDQDVRVPSKDRRVPESLKSKLIENVIKVLNLNVNHPSSSLFTRYGKKGLVLRRE